MTKRRAVVVTGSRDWTDRATIQDVLYSIAPHLVIHGDYRGADKIAEEVSEGRYRTIPMPAQWDAHGNGAGPLRNSRMVEVAQALAACGYHVTCEAFPLFRSRGTHDCINKMLAAGFKVNKHKPNG